MIKVVTIIEERDGHLNILSKGDGLATEKETAFCERYVIKNKEIADQICKEMGLGEGVEDIPLTIEKRPLVP